MPCLIRGLCEQLPNPAAEPGDYPFRVVQVQAACPGIPRGCLRSSVKSALAILTYQRLPALKAMLGGVEAHCREYPLAIFEDCGQHDGTSAFLARGTRKRRDDLMAYEHDYAQGVKTFLGQQNLGVAGNSNRALKWFMDETDADHLLLCNDDLFVLGDFAKFYAQAHQDLDIGFFSFTDFWDSPTHRWVICRSRGYRIKVFQRMTGIMMSTLRRVVNKVGYFDTRFGKFGNEHCDWTNRIRFGQEIQLDGQDQMGLDVEPAQPDGSAGAPVLKPQAVETSVTGAERAREDALSVERMAQAAARYTRESHYRPFTLTWPSHVGGVGDAGIPSAEIPNYRAVTSS